MADRILPKTLNADELCEVFNISRRTLSDWTDRKYIPFMRAGKNLYFDYEDIKKALHHLPYIREGRSETLAKRIAKGKMAYRSRKTGKLVKATPKKEVAA